ncbi:hypothetical protein Pla175_33230 [Pirellulimonas nuda]|uniref:Uncharacterized protein n=1 Tax=Pirellulimonas nuda TaxID=2528009 RepID=A0A518DEN7_9BACT|nr:hypothetical protein [Pirellulimonas nuda]QDU89926.1 hypothetical protein Pla175_33230 [Pirellulimonas nuda]
MFKQSMLTVAALALVSAGSARADHHHHAYRPASPTDALRQQVGVLEFQASRLLVDCADRHIILGELGQLRDDLNRLDAGLAAGVRTRRQLERLADLAHHIDEHACVIEEKIGAAVAWLERRQPQRRVVAYSRPVVVQRVGFGQPGFAVSLSGSRGAIALGQPAFVGAPLRRHSVGYAPAPQGVDHELCALRDGVARLHVLAIELHRQFH